MAGETTVKPQLVTQVRPGESTLHNVTPRDEVVPDGRWEFNAEVANVFEDMLRRSIPQYDVMRLGCLDLADRIVRRLAHDERGYGVTIVDLGCSRGDAIARLAQRYTQARFVGAEVSPAMIAAARERFEGQGHVRIEECDLRSSWPVRAGEPSVAVILSVLTVQFTPIEYRLEILTRVHDALMPGGALVFVEKVLGNGATVNRDYVALYETLKTQNGYTQEQIDRKRLSLEGVLVPVTARMNEEFLRVAGFRQVDCFWRWLNFAGWIAYR